MTGEYTHLDAKIVWKMARNKVIGKHNKQQDTIANWFSANEQGKIKTRLDEMATDPNVPIVQYGGSRNTVHLTSMHEAEEFIQENYDDEQDDFWLGTL